MGFGWVLSCCSGCCRACWELWADWSGRGVPGGARQVLPALIGGACAMFLVFAGAVLFFGA
jgi:hypothetical protein